MKRVGYIGLICIALCAGGITLARRIGGTQVSPLAVIFTMPDGTPCPEVCLFGATPGKTSYDQAVALLQQHPVTRTFQRRESGNAFVSVFESESADFAVRIARSQDSDTLAWIMLMNVNPTLSQVSSATGTLGQMLSLLGSPAGVDADDLVLTETHYTTGRIALLSTRAGDGDSAPVGIDDPVVSILLYAPGQLENATGVRNQQFKAWQGFRQVWHYRNSHWISFPP